MPYKFKIVSSDSHIYEPPNLWITRAEKRFRERAPRIIPKQSGDWWYCDGIKLCGIGPGTQTGRRFQNPKALSKADRLEHLRPGGYDPDARLVDMDAEGIHCEIVYPTVSLLLYQTIQDNRFLTSLFSTYNAFCAEYCETHPERLKGIAVINLEDVEEGVR